MEFQFNLAGLGELRGTLNVATVRDIETEVGGILGAASRFATGQASLRECSAILHRMCRERMDNATPKRDEIDAAILETGLAKVVGQLTPVFERLLDGVPQVA